MRASLLLGWLFCVASVAVAHDGPDPVAHWVCSAKQIKDGKLVAKLGPDATFSNVPKIVTDDHGESLQFGNRTSCVVAEDYKTITDILPKESMTVSAWVAIDKPEEWGGIVGAIEDNGDTERGWLLGYNQKVFTFLYATQGGDDGNGRMTVLQGTTPHEAGRLYHVTAVYDGKTAELYVNGKREAFSEEQTGPLLYPSRGPFVIGSFRDRNEDYRLQGRIRNIKLFDVAAKAEWVAHEFEHHEQLANLAPKPLIASQGFVVEPYLQNGTQTGMTVMWRTAAASTSVVHYGETAECLLHKTVEGKSEIHEVRIEGLEPETQYFYAVESQLDDGSSLEGEVYTFSTAVKRETPFAFAVFGDTQMNPTVSAKLADMAWAQRPSFLLHAGDLVDRGGEAKHWTEHFFPGLKPLGQRVPFYPVLGNHEDNHQNYFDYVSLPNPEYWYTFTYGNAEFFMIDSNRNMQPGSDQYEWLDKALGASQATWKVACHHHPPYSSDEDDYGNLWKVNKSTRGDLRARELTALYDKHHVDIVWNGHIHSYERTWPVREGKAVEKDGTVYMITGGAGGGLETAGTFRPYFTNNVKHGHHYCMVAVNGGTIEIKAFDLEGRLYDTVTLKK